MPQPFRGVTVCACVPPVVEAMEAELGRSVRITQGGYNAGGVSASAGTHDGGGVLDLATDGNDAADLAQVRAGRTVGFWGWVRQPSEGPWGQHHHGIVIGCPHKSQPARGQERDAYNGLNGLANRGPDPHRALKMTVRSFDMYQEVDVALTAEDKAWIAAAIENGSKDTHERVRSTIGWLVETYVRPIKDRVFSMKPVVEVDVQALAAEIVSALPANDARAVADEIAKRLAS